MRHEFESSRASDGIFMKNNKLSTLHAWMGSGLVVHFLVWLLFREAVTEQLYLAIAPLIFGLPLSIAINLGRTWSKEIASVLGIKDPGNAEILYKKAIEAHLPADKKLAEKFWIVQVIGFFWAGVGFFWVVLIAFFLI